MNRAQIEALLKEVEARQTSVPDALSRLNNMPFEDLGFAKLDHHRALRTGMPEVIFAAGKTTDQVARIFAHMAKAGGNVLATRASQDHFDAVRKSEPRATYHSTARAITLEQTKAPTGKGTICVVCAGTSDLPVAEEAAITTRLMGNTTELIADVGVAGIHRLLAQRRFTSSPPASPYRLCRNGRRSPHGSRRSRQCSGPRRPNQRRLRSILRRCRCPPRHAQHLLPQCLRRQHRQRLRRRL